MYVVLLALILALGGSSASGSGGAVLVPSPLASWPNDLRARIEPTPACPGGTVESLRKRMNVSASFDSPEAFQAVVRERLPPLMGLMPGDAFHQVYFHADLPNDTFWGFGGYIVVRAGCIVHADITSYDN